MHIDKHNHTLTLSKEEIEEFKREVCRELKLFDLGFLGVSSCVDTMYDCIEAEKPINYDQFISLCVEQCNIKSVIEHALKLCPAAKNLQFKHIVTPDPKSKQCSIFDPVNDTGFAMAHYSTMGNRPTQEDAEFHVIFEIEGNSYTFEGVCDGHGGHKVAHYAAQNLPIKLYEVLKGDPKISPENALLEAFRLVQVGIDNHINTIGNYVGCTVSSMLTKCQAGGATERYTANLGDSRVVSYANGNIEATEDHKPGSPSENARLKKAGHTIVFCGFNVSRVDDILAVSRALGDNGIFGPYSGKENSKGQSHIPEIKKVAINPENLEFTILACDGLWDEFSNEEACNLVKEKLDQGIHPQVIAAYLSLLAIQKGSGDNISVIIKVNPRKYPWVKELKPVKELENSAVTIKELEEIIAKSKHVLAPKEVREVVKQKTRVDAIANKSAQVEEIQPNIELKLKQPAKNKSKLRGGLILEFLKVLVNMISNFINKIIKPFGLGTVEPKQQDSSSPAYVSGSIPTRQPAGFGSSFNARHCLAANSSEAHKPANGKVIVHAPKSK